jgi:hypothetical protein
LRKWIVGATVAAIAIPSVSSTALGAACLRTSDAAAINARMMQTELMVAALTCQRRGEYNAFVKQFEGELISHGKKLKATFKRMYGLAGESQLNRFVTRLANEASLRSLQSTDYCDKASGLFTGTFAIKPGKLAHFAAGQTFSTLHGLPYCEDEQRVAEVK